MSQSMTHRRDRGLAVALVLSVLVVLSLTATVGMALLTQRMRSVGGYRQASRALYCAEAGLAAGRAFAQANFSQWAAYFTCNTTGTCPAGYPLVGSAAADGSAAYEVRLMDNADELPPQTADPLRDSDLTVIVVSRCTEAGLPARVLQEYVTIDANMIGDYRSQEGLGRAGMGNQN